MLLNSRYDYKPLTREEREGRRLYATPSGAVPSVTTILDSTKDKTFLIEWRKRVGEETANRISKQATSRGTNLHTLCEKYLNNDPTYLLGSMPDALEMFKSVKSHLNRINNIHYQEQALWSVKIGMAGRVDCIGEFDGVLSVIDFKTSKRIKSEEDIPDYFAQCTAYALMYEELIGHPIDDLVIIMAVEHEKPLIFQQKTEKHIPGLVQCIHDYKKSA